MLKWMFRRKLREFEREREYDASYLHEVIDTDAGALVKFGLAASLGTYRKEVPLDVYFAAQLTSSVQADCGPCTQLGVGYAIEAGVEASTIAAIVAGDETAMPPDVALGARFARALLARDPEVDTCREEIEARWGRRAVLSITFAIMTAQMFPTLKYALGHGKACTRVLVAGTAVTPPALTAGHACLARVVSRLCLDRMKSASHRREQYVGTWLPEPIVAEPARSLADDLSVALLLTLERLSPLERAAFLLHDVFDMDYAEIADTIDRSEAACRQLAARARQHVRDERPRYERNDEEARKLAEAFAMAATTGDVDALARMLAEDAVLYTDAGGKRLAAHKPIYGKDRILRFYEGVSRKGGVTARRVEPATLNGLPGFVLHGDEGTETLAVEVADGQIVALYLVRNPDKLRHLS